MIPIYCFDEHNEAFYFWHKAKYEGYISEPLDLFHIDAHSDIEQADSFRKSIYFFENQPDNYLSYYKDFAGSELDIANFIRPAVLSGIIKDIYFISPQWRKVKDRRKRLNICSVFGEGKRLKYGLEINSRTDSKVFKAYPDLKWFNYYIRRLDKIPKNRKVILDIDLDYFACIDSTSNLMHYELEITKDQFDHKDALLSDRRLPFSGFDFVFMQRNNKCYVKISHKKVKDIAHLPPKEEIESEINKLVEALKIKKIRPVAITICRSCYSGYCPEDYQPFIEAELKKKLETL